MAKNKPGVISLFSGALGLDLGLEKAGFEIAVTVENNKHAADTIRLNRPKVALIEKDIRKVSTREILKAANLKVGEALIVSGGPSCQTFSTAGSRTSLKDPRGTLFHEFLRVVREAKPKYFIMENVPGMLSAAVRHRPLKNRGHGYPVLGDNEELGSAFALILKELRKTGYYVVFDVLNAADYGVPQSRNRVVFIGSREGKLVSIPEPTHSQNGGNGRRKWVPLSKAIKKLSDINPEYVELSPKAKKYLKEVPAGGNWTDLPSHLQWRAMGNAYHSWGGRVGFFRRLSWEKPSPSLTTSPISKATMLCHPTKLRPLSVEEYQAIQQFPKRWKFAGSTARKYQQIGNAVPVGLGFAIGAAVQTAIASRRKTKLKGVMCKNETLIARLQARPRTMVNPARMRKVKSTDLTKQWVNHRKRRKHIFLKFLLPNPTISKKIGIVQSKLAA